MKRHRISDPLPKGPSVLTIGTFDGVHLGHQKIIKRVIEVAGEKNLTPTILTFFPHPRMVLQPGVDLKLLNTIDERKTILKNLGVENLVIKTFDQEFAKYNAEDYVREVLVEQLNAQYVVIGYDHLFGRRRSAGINDLKALSSLYKFKVEEIPVKDIDEVSISSTKIRNALDHGDILTANTYLGYNFYLNGTVVKGKGLGHKIGFPTANIKIEESYKLIPKIGVYIVQCNCENGEYYGMMNIGTNPTVGGKNLSLEVNLFDFEANIYDSNIEVRFLKRIRDEINFKSIEELKMQLFHDKAEADHYILNMYE